jgi:type II restriction enzyme
MKRIPVKIAKGNTITLSPGGQNALIEKVIDATCSRFTPGGNVIYAGDTDEKGARTDWDLLKTLDLAIENIE